jgi:polyphosphate kinase
LIFYIVNIQNMPSGKVEIINREISWLSFNERVLQEATDSTVPLIERIKFLGIFSNNRDEFYRVRVGTLKRMLKIGKKANSYIHEDPAKILKKIHEISILQQEVFESAYKGIIKELEDHQVFMLNETQLSTEQGDFVKQYFHEVVRPTLVPIMLDKKYPLPYLKEKTTHLLVKLSKSKKAKYPKYSLLEVPAADISRFLLLPSGAKKKCIILLDDVIRFCLNDIFYIFEYKKIEAYTIKLTRDAELDIDNDINKSLIGKIKKSIQKRKSGAPVRVIYDSQMPPDLLELLVKKIKFSKEDNLMAGSRYHNFKDFIDFPDVGLSHLKYETMPALPHPELADAHKSVLDVVKRKDLLLSFPYQSFSHIIDMLREAAIDPKVTSIKATIYRVAKNSNIINTLVNAAKNGKNVTVVIELQARFDEENNIYYANKLQEEGVKVIFGIAGLKVHSKLFLITRKKGNKYENFAHIGTGNFNEQTSKIYSDHSLLTADKRITSDVQKIFQFLTSNFKTASYKHLIVSPFFMRKKFIRLIQNEIKNSKEGKEAFIYLKLNNLLDDDFIKKLYEASNAGVKIKLIARSVCSLIPGIKGLSENIEAISIVDRFLEHSRLFIFANAGKELYFISSADWMSRNLDYRIEVACPVYDSQVQKEINDFFSMQMKGNVKARLINGDRNNTHSKIKAEKPFRAQYEIYNYYKNKLNK